MAKTQRLSRMAVQRIRRQHNLQPHRIDTFKLSRDKNFVAKLRDVEGHYMNPLEKALVLPVDEKTDPNVRPLPACLPMKKGRAATMTNE